MFWIICIVICSFRQEFVECVHTVYVSTTLQKKLNNSVSLLTFFWISMSLYLHRRSEGHDIYFDWYHSWPRRFWSIWNYSILNICKQVTVPRKLFFGYTAENSHHLKAWITSKKSAVSRGENISKKTGQKSSKYREIFKKPYFCFGKSQQITKSATATHVEL